MASQAKPEGEGGFIQQPLSLQGVWGSADAIEPQFADQINVAKVSKDYFHVTFGQLFPSQMDPKLARIAIRPLTTLIIPREALGPMIDVLQKVRELP